MKTKRHLLAEGGAVTSYSKLCDEFTTPPEHRQAAKLLKKPLKDHLTGLLNQVDRLPDNKIKQAIIDSVMVILIEVSRHDLAGGHL
jgi:hypothetical protein